MTLPPPLTPPESDLRDFQFMPLDVTRLAQSDLVAFEEPAAIVAAILLWGAAWHGKPAGSLTNDDRALARAAGFGRGLTEWLAVKEGALRGFVECSDGRLYHPVVCDKVRDAWAAKVRQRHKTFLAAVRKHNERNPEDQRDGPSFEAWERMGRPKEVASLAPAREQTPCQENLPLDEMPENSGEQLSRVTDDNVTRDMADKSRDTGQSHAPVTPIQASKGQGEGQGEGEGQMDRESLTSDAREKNDAATGEGDGLFLSREQLLTIVQRLARCGAVALRPERPGPFTRELDLVKGWLADGIDVDKTIVPTIAKRLSTTAEDTIGSLKFYDRDVRKAHALTLAKAEEKSRPAAASQAPARKWPKLREPDTDDDRVRTIRDQLRAGTGSQLYDQWLAPDAVSLRLDPDDGLLITTRASFAAQWIATSMIDTVRRIAADVLGSDEVRVVAQQ